MIKIALILLSIFAAISSSHAGGRGGHNTTFDPNSYGGGWKFLDTDFGAVCDGNPANSSTNDAAINSWLAYGVSQGLSLAKLKTPPGICVTSEGFTCDNPNDHSGPPIRNAIIWGYGTTYTAGWVGGNNYPNGGVGTAGSALIQAATTGDMVVTLITAAQNTIFSVGDSIAITAEATQTFGNPSHSIFEYNIITSINAGTGVIGLGSPLKNSGYKTTYPQLDPGSSLQINQGGPATIYKMDAGWNTNCRVLGLTFDIPNGQVNFGGKENYVLDVTFTGSFAPSSGRAEWLHYVQAGSSAIEVDKNIELWYQYNSMVGQIAVQNGSINQFIVYGGSSTNVNGTSTNSVFTNHLVFPPVAGRGGQINAGPTGGGRSLSLVLDGVNFVGAFNGRHNCPMSAFSYSSGTLTIASTDPNFDCSTRLWVVGTKYFMGDDNGDNTCIPANTFTVTDLIGVGTSGVKSTSVQVVTDFAGGSLPSGNICNANTTAVTQFAAYKTMTLTQKFSGPANLLSIPSMLPP